MSDYLIRSQNGFDFGYTILTEIGEVNHDTGIEFGILKLKKSERIDIYSELETAYLLIKGDCFFRHDDVEIKASRNNCFDEDPYVLHCAANQLAVIEASSDCEFAVSKVYNDNNFATTIYHSNNLLENEHRGQGLLNDTAFRIVRTVFDTRNNPLSNLVLGEVITAPGRWSSYPPHHHPHPEIYHYRFTEPQGYGHAECGDDVFKVREYDTYKILNQNNHAQAAAPGYGMYYIWVIRHLEKNPYIQPEFVAEHSWTKTEIANQRVWKGF